MESHSEKVMGPPMAHKLEKSFFIFTAESYLQMSVSTETSLEELENLSLPADYVPEEKIIPIYLGQSDYYRSLVSVNSMVYCIGGSKFNEQLGDLEPSNEVTKFHPYQPELEHETCCNMIQPRLSPAVVSICGKIYVFGGLPDDEENCKECPFAEFLDTNEPQGEQKWKALKEPVSRLLKPFAIHYEANTILIGSTTFPMNLGAIIYNVADESSLEYNFDAKTMSCASVTDPVTTFSNKTIYWIDHFLLRAYELDTHIHYQVPMRQAFPDFVIGANTLQGPVLVHLKDDLFNVFTIFGNTDSYPKIIGIVECTKLRVKKYKLKSGEGVLKVDHVGYQSYQCDWMWNVLGAFPIEARRGYIGSTT